MRIESTTTFCAHGNDKTAMQALHLMQTFLGCTVRSVCAESETPPDGSVSLVTTSHIRYPSKYIRVLEDPQKLKEPTERLLAERTCVAAEHPWTEQAGLVVCLNPQWVTSTAGLYMNRGQEQHLDGILRSLRNICGLHPKKVDPLAGLSPEEKKRARMNQAQNNRRNERYTYML